MGRAAAATETPIVFLRIGWMDRYRGQSVSDQIQGGGAFVAKHGYGHEIFNFQPFDGRLYGYVQPSRGGHNQRAERGIKIERLGAPKGQESIDGVLVIWVATRIGGDEEFGYYVTAAEPDSWLVEPVDRRWFEIPRGKGGIGQSNVWYADDRELHSEIRHNILSYVAANGRVPKPNRSSRRKGTPHQPDPHLRQKVERIAMDMASDHFTSIGYDVKFVHEDNMGWDLDAVRGKIKLRVEAKGLSGPDISVELTPNEYAKMQEHRDSYRLCVVTSALTKPTLTVFAYSHDINQWADQNDAHRQLLVAERKAAWCRVL